MTQYRRANRVTRLRSSKKSTWLPIKEDARSSKWTGIERFVDKCIRGDCNCRYLDCMCRDKDESCTNRTSWTVSTSSIWFANVDWYILVICVHLCNHISILSQYLIYIFYDSDNSNKLLEYDSIYCVRTRNIRITSKNSKKFGERFDRKHSNIRTQRLLYRTILSAVEVIGRLIELERYNQL